MEEEKIKLQKTVSFAPSPPRQERRLPQVNPGSFASRPPEEPDEIDVEEPTRVTTCCNRLFMNWCIPVIKKGFRVQLEKDDVPYLEKIQQSKVLLGHAQGIWTTETDTYPANKRSLLRVIFKMPGRMDLILGAALGILRGVLFSVARPLLLRQLVLQAANPASPFVNSVGFVLGFCFVVLIEGIVSAMSKQLLSTEFGIKFFAYITALLQKKSITAGATGGTANQVPGLVGHNISRLVEDWKFGCLIFDSATSIVGGLIILLIVLRVAALPGLGCMVIIFTCNMRLGHSIRRIEREGDEVSARRISLTQDLAANALGLKLAAWEEPFKKILKDVRLEDTQNIEHARRVSVTSINFGRASPVIASSLSVVTLAYLYPSSLNAATIFTALTSFQGLRLPLIALPNNIIQLQNMSITFDRLLSYLNMEDAVRPPPEEDCALRAENVVFSWTIKEEDDIHHRHKSSTESRRKVFQRIRRSMGSMRHLIAAPGAELSLQEEEEDIPAPPVMKRVSSQPSGVNLTVDFYQKRLVGVVGMVASGKTTLLTGLLGHLPISRGSIHLSKSVGYVTQKPFVLSGTILDNILMGKKLNQELLWDSLQSSDFAVDVEHLPNGLNTIVGERGMTLSGGQKQRLCICRAFYKNPELLVMDDPLAAVDVKVAKNIMENGVVPFVNGDRHSRRAVLMTLNQLHFLHLFDWIVVMHEGAVVEQGTFADLKRIEEGRLVTLMKDAPKAYDESMTSMKNAEQIEKSQEDSSSVSSSEQDPPQRPTSILKNVMRLKKSSTSPEDVNKFFASYYVPKDSDKQHNDLVSEEVGKKGTGVIRIVRQYFARMGSYQLPLSLLIGGATYSVSAANDIELAYWIRDAKGYSFDTNIDRAFLYFGLSMLLVFLMEGLSLFNMKGSVRASKKLHDEVVENLLHAPISFFESTPSGRIVSRLSGDLTMVDRMLAFVFDDLVHFTMTIIALTAVIGVIVTPLISFMILAIILFALQLGFVDRTNREAKRFTNQALGPIMTNLSETVNARAIIQTMNFENFFITRHCRAVDEYNRYSILTQTVVTFGSLMTGYIGFVTSVGAAFLVIGLRADLTPAFVGLALVYSLILPYFLGILSTSLPIGLTGLTSLERILDYCSTSLPSERPWHLPRDKDLDSEWPSKGSVTFESVELIYRPGLPPSLKSISFHVEGGEVVGIVGKTGAGKSSIVMALLRIHEISSGRIVIDGVDVSQIGIQTLRTQVAIIPQEAVLLRGTVRFNVDPFSGFTEEEINAVCTKVGLSIDSLNATSAEFLSSGERQLLQLARVLLRKKVKIILFDEPTANIDATTDKALDIIIREAFLGRTRLVIAHRLSTVLESDKICVMGHGSVLEFDTPANLLQKENGAFRTMMDVYNQSVV